MKNIKFLAVVLSGALATSAFAVPGKPTHPQPHPKPQPPKEAVHWTKEIRDIALKMDNISKTQERPACIRGTDGLLVYTAGAYLHKHRILESKYLLDRAVIRGHYTMDIDCKGKEEIEPLVHRLAEIRDGLTPRKAQA